MVKSIMFLMDHMLIFNRKQKVFIVNFYLFSPTDINIYMDMHSSHSISLSPQQAQRARGIVRDWQIFGHGSDFSTWSELGTNSKVKSPNFWGNFEPSYLFDKIPKAKIIHWDVAILL